MDFTQPAPDCKVRLMSNWGDVQTDKGGYTEVLHIDLTLSSRIVGFDLVLSVVGFLSLTSSKLSIDPGPLVTQLSFAMGNWVHGTCWLEGHG